MAASDALGLDGFASSGRFGADVVLDFVVAERSQLDGIGLSHAKARPPGD